MGIFDFFLAGTPEKHEQRADTFVIKSAYGHAKLEYEKALARIERLADVKPGCRDRIEDKLKRCKESLAREHRREGKSLVAAGCENEARGLFGLALELTEDARLAADVAQLLDTIPEPGGQSPVFEYFEPEAPFEDAPITPPGSDEEYFEALCNSLEDTERDAYRQYPDAFKTGFISLNRGDFDAAVDLLSEAAAVYPFGANYITLELATAHLNRGAAEKARDLLESFLQEYPESLRAYHLLCETLWEMEAFDEAAQLLANCPSDLGDLLPVKMLAGETFMRSGKFTRAAVLYRDLMQHRGWDPVVAQALAAAYEALEQYDRARDLYGEIINTCTGCNARVDPAVKQRFAETSFALGDFSMKILELYLALVQEDPDNRTHYYGRVSHIYAVFGNEHEAHRFAAFAEQADTEEGI